MPLDADGGPAADFEAERGRLTGLAYRMLGALSEAEDVVQDAWLRWSQVDLRKIDKPRSYLSSVVTRLCLDRLKQARRKREIYVGPWLPEPLLEDPARAGLAEHVFARDVTFALMLTLERLSPLERAAFILHDVFDVGFAEIAETLGRTETTCRQLAKRARENVRAGRGRFTASAEDGQAIADAFFAASRSGDVATLGRILASRASLHADGGGRKAAALRIVTGAARIARFYAGLVKKALAPPPQWARPATINSLPAMLTIEQDGTRQATAVDVRGGKIRGIYVIRNPDKLERLWSEIADSEPG